ncbi:MFS transporter [Candidatus Comchoanobacter bicostacola]|uniref:Lysosomal dipeptide transporter MFSD1 n=1 Tax=Candidatus Comchoanobacter bicostacola TaxID=2919598 RepID=A0ABY5DNF2_9GAMM|nr:MFS transporter [Candidatus Comchoanobacter bicostacola]UTC24964.1 MFS transporter [Candidatus Comchoanobacter bicostacola]
MQGIRGKVDYSVAAWLIVAVSAIFYSYDVLLRVAPSVMTSELMDHYSINAYALSGVTAMYFYIYAPMQMPVGFLMDRYGPKQLLTMSGLICSVGIYLFSMTNVVWVAMLSRVLIGFGSSFAFVGVLKLASLLLPSSYFAFVSGSTMALGMLGATLGDHVLAYFKSSVGWRNVCIGASGIGLVLTFLMLISIPSRSRMSEGLDVTSSFDQIRRDLMSVAKSRIIWIYALVGCLTYTPLILFAELFGIDFIQVKFACTHVDAAKLNSLIFMGWLIGGPLVCMLSDFFKSRKLPLLVGTIGSLVCSWLIIYVNVPIVFLPFLLLLFGVLNSVQVIVFPVAKDLSAASTTASAVALMNMVCMLSGMMQTLVGRLLEYTHFVLERNSGVSAFTVVDYQISYLTIPIFLFIAVLLLISVKDSYKEDEF